MITVEAPSIKRFDSLLSNAKKVVERYPIIFVTEAFLGGINTGEIDIAHPVRESSIRGQLRFWWRATRGAIYPDPDALRKRERLIFGDTDLPSAIQITVENVNRGPKEDAVQITDSGNQSKKLVGSLTNYKYALFPYPMGSGKAEFFKDLRFELVISYMHRNTIGTETDKLMEQRLELDQLMCEVKAALWAWINFGGLGARTRRGCGSLYCKTFSPDSTITTSFKLSKWIKSQLAKYHIQISGNSTELQTWPVLKNIVVNQSILPNDQAWEKGLSHYKSFRRMANLSKKLDKNGKSKPGRSHWPEADSIRLITGEYSELHKEPVCIPEAGRVAFPRAQLGLPITFKFASKGDPYETKLLPVKDRLASPLIIKTVATSREKGFSAYVILGQPRIKELRLQVAKEDAKHSNKMSTNEQLEQERLKQKIESRIIQEVEIYSDFKHKLYPLRDVKGDAVQGFTNYMEVKRWVSVIPTNKP